MVYLISKGDGLEIHYVSSGKTDSSGQLIDIKDIRFLDRGQALKWHKFSNYWNNTNVPFNVDLYNIKNIN